MLKDYFTYNDGKDITNGAFRISASKVSDFFDRTSAWYHEHLLGEGGFQGSTASELGTVVHAGLEMQSLEGQVHHNAIEDYVLSIENEEVDKQDIMSAYLPMLDAGLQYLERHPQDVVEEFVFHELLPGIGVGGSIDARTQRIITDWKTTSAKTAPTKFSRAYWFQQMTYAWVLKQKGVNIEYLKLVYITKADVNRVSEKTGKPLKDYPSVVTEVVEEVTEEKLDLIGSCLMLIAESVQLWAERPDLRHILAQDMRLKPKPKPIIFNKE